MSNNFLSNPFPVIFATLFYIFCPVLRSKGFKDYDVWNPLGDVVHETNLQDIFNKPALNVNSPALGKLFDALYSPQEQEAKLDVGFRGRPPIGSIIMSRPKLDDLQDIQGALWQKFLADLETDKGSGERFLSIFLVAFLAVQEHLVHRHWQTYSQII